MRGILKRHATCPNTTRHGLEPPSTQNRVLHYKDDGHPRVHVPCPCFFSCRLDTCWDSSLTHHTFFCVNINMQLTQLNKNELNRLRLLNARLRYHQKRNGGLGAHSKQYRDIWKERSNFMKQLSNKYYGGNNIVSNYRTLGSVSHNKRLRTAARSVSAIRRAQLNKREARRLVMMQLSRNGIPWPIIHRIMRNI